MPSPLEDIKTLIRTRHSLVSIQTVEEEYAARMIRETAREMGLMVMEWACSTGLYRTVPTDAGVMGGTEALRGALSYLAGNPTPAVYVLKDACRFLDDPANERLLREVAMNFASDTRTVFLIDPNLKLPPTLAAMAVPFEVTLPDDAEILALVKQTIKQLTAYGQAEVDLTQEQVRQFLANLKGLTRQEITQVVASAILSDGKITADDIDLALQTKQQRLKRAGVLEYIPPPPTMPDVGGMGNLRKWLVLRAKAFTPEAKAYGLDPPKGLLMLGVQGCGKSLMARFVAAQWHMPLVRMDVGALYDKFVGQTERQMREAFATAQSVAPCVLWIDEIEKAFASAGGGAEGAISDGGLSQRVFGMLLTWMQDRPAPVFVVATANDVTALPPELMRKGRFDEIFFVDLPGTAARESIFKIQLAKRKRDGASFNLKALAAASAGFSGAEIEQAVVSAMYTAFAASRQPTTQDLLAELAATKPLSVVMAEKINALRAWATDRCVPAD